MARRVRIFNLSHHRLRRSAKRLAVPLTAFLLTIAIGSRLIELDTFEQSAMRVQQEQASGQFPTVHSFESSTPLGGHRGSSFRVIDGDTVALGEERIRIENIDTPETGSRAECDYERHLAAQATNRARQIFAQAEEVRASRTGEDRYGRTLALVSVDGRDFGAIMVEEELAVRWAGRQHDWCG